MNKDTNLQINTNPPLVIPNVSGSFLRIYEHTHRRQKHLASNSNFFEDDVKIDVDDYYIYITRPSLDYRGKTYKAHNRNGIYHTAIVDERLKCGEFQFDVDESTDDCLVVNYR